jgi:hypothetical protein
MKFMACHFLRDSQNPKPMKMMNKYAKIAYWCVNRAAQIPKNHANSFISNFLILWFDTAQVAKHRVYLVKNFSLRRKAGDVEDSLTINHVLAAVAVEVMALSFPTGQGRHFAYVSLRFKRRCQPLDLVSGGVH